MLSILFDGLVLIAVLAALSGHDFGGDLGDYFKAGLLAFATSIVGVLIGAGLESVLPALPALFVGLGIASLGLAFVISQVYGLDFKRSILCVVIFFGISVAFRLFLVYAIGWSTA